MAKSVIPVRRYLSAFGQGWRDLQAVCQGEQSPVPCQTPSAESAPPLLTPQENWLLHRRAKLVFAEQTKILLLLS